jgi:hypothetical protein
VAKKIGATNSPVAMDYNSVKAYLDAMPADLTAVAAGTWDAEIYNQGGAVPLGQTSQYVKTVTTDASHPLQWYAATGHSIFDDTDNPMRYDASLGAAIEGSVGYSKLIAITTKYFSLSRLQLRNTSVDSQGCIQISHPGSAATLVVEGNVFSTAPANTNYNHVLFFGSSYTGGSLSFSNNVVISENGKGWGAFLYNCAGNAAYNNTFILRGTAATGTTGLYTEYNSATAKNNVFMGWLKPIDADNSSRWAADGHNATDQSSWPTNAGTQTGSLTSIPFTTDTFVSVTSGSEDYNLAAASDLIDAGTSSGTPTTDAYGRDRSTNDIGASEYTTSGTAVEATPTTGTVSVQGYAPSVGAGVTASPTAGSVSIQGLAPTAGAGVTASPTTGAVSVQGYAPTASVGVTASPGAGSVAVLGYAPAASAGVVAAPDTGAVDVTGYEATASAGVNATPGAGSVAVQGYAPTAVAENPNATAEPDTGTVVVVGFAPTATATTTEEPVVDTGGGVRRSRRRKAADRSSVPYSEKNADDLARRIREAREPAPVEVPEPKAKPAPKLVEADVAADRAADAARQAAAQEFARGIEATVTPEMLALAAATQHFAVDKSETTKSMVSNADEEAIIALLLAA